MYVMLIVVVALLIVFRGSSIPLETLRLVWRVLIGSAGRWQSDPTLQEDDKARADYLLQKYPLLKREIDRQDDMDRARLSGSPKLPERDRAEFIDHWRKVDALKLSHEDRLICDRQVVAQSDWERDDCELGDCGRAKSDTAPARQATAPSWRRPIKCFGNKVN